MQSKKKRKIKMLIGSSELPVLIYASGEGVEYGLEQSSTQDLHVRSPRMDHLVPPVARVGTLHWSKRKEKLVIMFSL